MLKTHRVVLGESTYVLKQLPTAKGLNVLARVSKVLGPSFAAALRTADPSSEVNAALFGIRGIAELVTELSTRLSPEELEALTAIFVEHTNWEKDEHTLIPLKSVYSSHFQGDYGNLLRLLFEHLNFNFASFLDVLRGTALPS